MRHVLGVVPLAKNADIPCLRNEVRQEELGESEKEAEEGFFYSTLNGISRIYSVILCRRITKLLDGVERDLQALLKQAKSGEDLSPMKQASAQTDEGDGKLDQYVDSETDSASADQAGEEEDVVTESGNPSLLRKPLEFLASLQPDIVDQQNAWPNAQSQPETLCKPDVFILFHVTRGLLF